MDSTSSQTRTTYAWNISDLESRSNLFPHSIFLSSQSIVEECAGPLNGKLGIRAFRIQDPSWKTVAYYVFTEGDNRGGTFTNQNIEFLNFVIESALQIEVRIPFILCLESGGVRLTHDRSIYNPIWGLMPKFFQLRSRHFFITLAQGKCLGAAAVFFAQGQYRIATSPDTLINLTGQGVISGFFGQKENFASYASAAWQLYENHLIHEVCNEPAEAFHRVRNLLDFLSGSYDESPWRLDRLRLALSAPHPEGEVPSLDFEKPHEPLRSFLSQLGDHGLELMPQAGAIGRTFILKRKGKPFGVLINPPQNPKNLLNVRLIEKYRAALAIFNRLGLPIISCIDSPGGDPRQENSDNDIILRTVDLVEDLINYPHPKIGIIVGRCFGGVGMISLPIVHGSQGLYAFPNTKLGIMADQIIEDLVAGHARGVVEWEMTKKIHQRDLKDLVQSGTVREILSEQRLQVVLDEFLEVG